MYTDFNFKILQLCLQKASYLSIRITQVQLFGQKTSSPQISSLIRRFKSDMGVGLVSDFHDLDGILITTFPLQQTGVC